MSRYLHVKTDTTVEMFMMFYVNLEYQPATMEETSCASLAVQEQCITDQA